MAKPISSKEPLVRGRAVLIWLVATSVAGAICWLLYLREAHDTEQTTAEREMIRVGFFARLFGDDFRRVAADALVLGGSDTLADYLANGHAEDLKQFADEVQRFSRKEGAYDKIRYLDERGMERLRFDLVDGLVSDARLQDKSNRPFFGEAMKLRLGEVYLSAFDLNVEQGELERPFKPTLRFATPIFDPDGKPRGVVAINLLGSRQFERFQNLAPAFQHRLRVLNADGFWLHAVKPEMEWGFMLPERAGYTLAKTNPDLWRQVLASDQGRAYFEGGLLSWQRISPLITINQAGIPGRSGDPWLVIATHLNADEWSATFASVRRSYTLLALALLGLTTAGTWFYESRRRAAAQLRAADALNAAILQGANVAVISADPDGVITAFNPTAERMLGWTAAELVGKQKPSVFHDRAEVVARAGELAAELGRPIEPGNESFVAKARLGKTDEREWTYVRKDGSRFPVWLSVTSLRDSSGKITGFLGVAVDITDRKHVEKVLRDAQVAAEESARLKSQFLANMSHEIRTPMNGVVGMANLLMDSELTPEQRGFANTIRTSADALLAVINDILDFSKIEAGMLTFENLPFDLRDPVENCLALVAEKAHAKGLEIAYLIDEGVPTQLVGDAGRVHQVLLNLVGNAVKFTAHGEVIVRITNAPDGVPAGERRARLRFTVSDTGIGLTPEAQKKLFQPFMQADASTTRRFGGTGLGLAICRQLVHLMGGEISLESEAGKGSTFSFTIDLPLQEPALRFIPRKTDLAGRRALIVDDNATNRDILQRQLAAWRVETVIASSGSEAISAVRTETGAGRRCDFAILDMQMPGMDGLMLGKQLVAEPGSKGMKMVILSSIGRTLPQADLQAAGIAVALTKPVRQSLLHDTLLNLLASSTAAPRPVPRPETPAVAAGTDVKPLRILLAEDNLVNQNVARLQLARFGYKAAIVTDGRQAFAAVQQETFDVVLMDCQMPELDGFEATRLIREWEATRRAAGDRRDPLYVIAMTANAMQGDREACLAAGMNDYVSKPVRPADLAAALARAPAAQATM